MFSSTQYRSLLVAGLILLTVSVQMLGTGHIHLAEDDAYSCELCIGGSSSSSAIISGFSFALALFFAAAFSSYLRIYLGLQAFRIPFGRAPPVFLR